MNKILKILVIFFLMIIFVIIIYYRFNKISYDILSFGGEITKYKQNYLSNLKEYNINNSFSETQVTYQDIYNAIYNDIKIYDKGKYTNIKKVIRNSDIIIISANNKKTTDKCNKSKRILEEYLNGIYETTTKIVDQIENITSNKVVIISPYCNNEIAATYIDKYYNYKNVCYVNTNNLSNELNSNTISLVDEKTQYKIYLKIINCINN